MCLAIFYLISCHSFVRAWANRQSEREKEMQKAFRFAYMSKFYVPDFHSFCTKIACIHGTHKNTLSPLLFCVYKIFCFMSCDCEWARARALVHRCQIKPTTVLLFQQKTGYGSFFHTDSNINLYVPSKLCVCIIKICLLLRVYIVMRSCMHRVAESLR